MVQNHPKDPTHEFRSRSCAFASLLVPAAASAAPPQLYNYSFQLYDEGDGRIRIESHYIRGKISLDDDTTFRFQWLKDTISGASPMGAMPAG